MAVLAPALPFIAAAAAVAGTASAILNKPQAPVIPPPISLNQAQQQQNANDQLLGRVGGAADILNGNSGASVSGQGAKTALGN